VLGHLADETDQNGTVLATFTYDSSGVPVSVQVGSDPNTAPRYYYYVYNGHGGVVARVDTQGKGNSVASYSYDAFGQLTSASENVGGTTTWTNPYRYDGRDGVRYDGETGLYWMSVRAYDPALERFLSRDPLGRVPLLCCPDEQGINHIGGYPPDETVWRGAPSAEAVTAGRYLLWLFVLPLPHLPDAGKLHF
jgi:RHS repeat-associated protein